MHQGQAFPFILVSPQCPSSQWWTWPQLSATLSNLLDEVESKYAVDPERIYVTGLSMGGYGTWSLAMAYPQRFAAIVPISGPAEDLDRISAEILLFSVLLVRQCTAGWQPAAGW